MRLALRQVPVPLWPLLPIGALVSWRTRPALTAALLASAAALVLLVTVYRAQGREVYLIPAAFIGAVFVACGLVDLSSRVSSRERTRGVGARAVGAALLAATLIGWTLLNASAVSLRGDTSAVDEARAVLRAQPAGALLKTDRDELTFPLWYLRVVRGERPDVTIEDVRGLAPVIRGQAATQ